MKKHFKKLLIPKRLFIPIVALALFLLLFQNFTVHKIADGGTLDADDSATCGSFPQPYVQPVENVLLLNGTGIGKVRKFFKDFKVYEAALFIEKTSSDPDQITSLDSEKVISFCFLRDVDGEQLADNWIEDLLKHGLEQTEENLDKLEKMSQHLMPTKVTKGQTVSLLFLEDEMIFYKDDLELLSLYGQQFTDFVFYNFIYHPPMKLGDSLLTADF